MFLFMLAAILRSENNGNCIANGRLISQGVKNEKK
jgi:hypothetical protein